MTSTEQRYAQIEKEALATTWACEKFADYILGKDFTIETTQRRVEPVRPTRNRLSAYNRTPSTRDVVGKIHQGRLSFKPRTNPRVGFQDYYFETKTKDYSDSWISSRLQVTGHHLLIYFLSVLL